MAAIDEVVRAAFARHSYARIRGLYTTAADV